MIRLSILFMCLAVILWIGDQPPNLCAQQAADSQQEAEQSQEVLPVYADVAPIFNQRCIMCHSGAQSPLGLRLDSYANLMSGSENGPVVVSGNPEDSEIVRRIRGISQPRMPLTGPPWLSDEEIELIERWIAGGAAEGNKGDTSKKAVIEEVPPVDAVKDQPVTFTRVAPIMGRRCVKCHMDNGIMGPPPEGLRLDSYESILASRDRVRVIPGNPDASELVRRIEGRSNPRMPFDGPPYLEEAEIELITDWVEQGARDADGTKATVPVGARVRLEGRLTGKWALDGLPLIVDGATRLKKDPAVGDHVEVRGVVQGDGGIRATRIRHREAI